MKCSNCESTKLKIVVPVYCQFDVKMFRKQVKKSHITDKNTRVGFTDWDKSRIICESCGYNDYL